MPLSCVFCNVEIAILTRTPNEMGMKKIAVLGLGKAGGLVSELLQECGFDVTRFDAYRDGAPLPFEVAQIDVSDTLAHSSLPDKGFLKQEGISLDQFLKTSNGARYAA
jgi:hypothetical protein